MEHEAGVSGTRASSLLALAKVEAMVFRVPIETPVITSFGIMHSRPSVLVRAEDDQGAVGWGEIWCNFPSVGAEHRARLFNATVAPLLLEHRWRDPPEAFEALPAVHVLVRHQDAFGRTRGWNQVHLPRGQPDRGRGSSAAPVFGRDDAIAHVHRPAGHAHPEVRAIGSRDVYLVPRLDHLPERLAGPLELLVIDIDSAVEHFGEISPRDAELLRPLGARIESGAQPDRPYAALAHQGQHGAIRAASGFDPRRRHALERGWLGWCRRDG